MSTLIPWLSAENFPIVFFSTLVIAWIAAIIYFIPLQLYRDDRAVAIAQRSANQRSDHNLNGMQIQ